MPRRAYELGKEVDDPSAIQERLLRLWLQDLTTTIADLGMELQQMSEQIEAMEAEESPDERALRRASTQRADVCRSTSSRARR